MIALLAGVGFGYYTLCTLFVIVCILLVFMVVITPSQEGGMAAAFGGMGSDSFFGTKAHNAINKFTVFLAVSFLCLAFWINWSNKGGAIATDSTGPAKSELEKKVNELPKPAKSADGGMPPLPNK